MKYSRADKARVFLVNWVYTNLYGLALDEWLRLLRKHRFAIAPPHWPRAALMTLTSSATSLIRSYEDAKYEPELAGVRVSEPLFILGHWRSGTTYLQQLLAADERFASPNMWQVLNPHTFLATERYSGILRFAGPRTRLIDNMSFDADIPGEDEFATCGTLRSPFLASAFPRQAEHYDRYLTFRGVPEEEVAEWRAALIRFYKKLTWKYGLPLVLKSPPHTCRIRLILEMFPDARFVHLHRNPFAVFQSTSRQTLISLRATQLQSAHSLDLNARIIRIYRTMYDSFFEEKHVVPKGRFHELGFEELERDPVGQVKKIYERLDIPGFEEFEPSLKRHLASVSGYRKNEYPELPTAMRERIARAWERGFEEWGYPRD